MNFTGQLNLILHYSPPLLLHTQPLFWQINPVNWNSCFAFYDSSCLPVYDNALHPFPDFQSNYPQLLKMRSIGLGAQILSVFDWADSALPLIVVWSWASHLFFLVFKTKKLDKMVSKAPRGFSSHRQNCHILPLSSSSLQLPTPGVSDILNCFWSRERFHQTNFVLFIN